MTLSQAKRLKAGESFWRPSANSHDINGKRVYTVVSAHPCFHTVDQHGYHTQAGAIDPYDKAFFAVAVKFDTAA